MRFPSSPLRHRDVEICHNLRSTRRGDGLTSVGSPTCHDLKTLLRGGRLLPGGRITGPDGREWILMEYGGDLLCYDGKEVTRLSGGSGRPCGIVRSGDRYLVLMGEEEAMMWLFVNDNGAWEWRSAASLPEPLAIVRKDEGLITSRIGGCKLRGSYSSRSSHLTEEDEHTVSSAVRTAYRFIGNQARMREVFFQPVIARYSLLDREGNTLYTSAPVMLSSSVGQQLLSVDFTLSGEGFSTLESQTISVESFSIMLRPTAPLGKEWHGVVHKVRVLSSLPMHSYDGSSNSLYRFGSFTATAGALRVFVPGISDTVAAQGGYGSRLRTLTEGVLAGLDDCVTSIGLARFNPEAGEWDGVDQAFYGMMYDTDREVELLDEFIGYREEALAEEAAALASLSSSHWLCAAAADDSGDCIAYSNLGAKRFKGWLPSEFAVATAESDPEVPESAPVATKVTFADGSSCVRSGVVSGFSIGALSPLLTYPSAEAVKLELFYDNRSLSVPLRPDPSGRFAYWLSDSGAPVKMPENMPAFILPTESPRSVAYPGIVAVASASDPLHPVAAAKTSDSRPVALKAAPSSSGGWDAGSARFYLFGPEGTQALTVNSSRKRLTARRIDSRPVDRPDAVCDIGESAVAAIAGGDLVKVSGQKVSTLRPFVGAACLGWDGRRGELTCFHSSDCPCPENYTLVEGRTVTPLFPEAVVTDAKGRMLYSRSVPQMASLLSKGGGVWGIDTAGQLLDLCSERDDDEVEIYYRAILPASDAGASRRSCIASRDSGCRSFEIPLYGNLTAGRIEIRGDNGGGTEFSDVLTSCDLRGTVTHLPPLAVLSPHRHNYILNLHLRTSGNLRLL